MAEVNRTILEFAALRRSTSVGVLQVERAGKQGTPARVRVLHIV